ncbi:MAG: heme exporter protein CcmD [Methylohalobius sp. ZOD2]|nr:heme exporter protein CcmD [Methylothermaceae bacterium]
MNWPEFFHMGGYGAYVWSAYGLAAVVLVWNMITPWLKRREVMRKLKRLYRQEDLPS